MAKTESLPAATYSQALDPLAALVLNALPSVTDEQRNSLSAGDHRVDLEITIRVHGDLRIGADVVAKQVNKLKPWTLAKLLANKVHPDVLDECIHMALSAAKADHRDDARVAAMEAEADDLKVRVEALFEQAGMFVAKTRRGSVRLLGQVDVQVKE